MFEDSPLIVNQPPKRRVKKKCFFLLISFALCSISFALIAVVVIVIFLVLFLPKEFVVSTDCGDVEGFYNGNQGTYNFFGIPFVVPPTGDYRFLPPVSLKDAGKCWKGIKKTMKYKPICPQNVIFDGKGDVFAGDEDCVYINVVTPNITPKKKLPVIVYFYGGALVNGGCKQFDLEPVVYGKEVVIVTVNYRVGALGFLALDELSEVDPRGISGNLGFLDVIETFKWVKRNIENFGGNKDSVTAMGQSTGGTITLYLMISPLAKGLFNRVISISPSTKLAANYSEISNLFKKEGFLDNTKCKGFKKRELLDCLYSLSAKEVVNGLNPLFISPYGFSIPRDQIPPDSYPLAYVDGKTFPHSMRESFEKGLFNKVDSIIGYMQEEADMMPGDYISNYTKEMYENFINTTLEKIKPGLGKKFLKYYPFDNFDDAQQGYDQIVTDSRIACELLQISRDISKNGSNVYRYFSKQRPKNPFSFFPPEIVKFATHGLEIICSFECEKWFTLADRDKKYGDLVRRSFIEFAKTGKLNPLYWEYFGKREYFTSLQYPNIELIQYPKRDVCVFIEENLGNRYVWVN